MLNSLNPPTDCRLTLIKEDRTIQSEMSEIFPPKWVKETMHIVYHKIDDGGR